MKNRIQKNKYTLWLWVWKDFEVENINQYKELNPWIALALRAIMPVAIALLCLNLFLNHFTAINWLIMVVYIVIVGVAYWISLSQAFWAMIWVGVSFALTLLVSSHLGYAIDADLSLSPAIFIAALGVIVYDCYHIFITKKHIYRIINYVTFIREVRNDC